MTIESKCLLWGIRVVIPQKLQHQLQQELHNRHPSMVCMKAIARSYLWWPGLDKAFEHQVKSCKECRSVKSSPH